MRILPRVNLPTSKAARRLWRKSKARLNLRRIYYSVEVLLFIIIYFVVFSGGRLRTLDTFGHRTDAVVSLLLIAAFILIHITARRRLLPKIERYYAPAPYDERKIFFDLGQGSQNVTSIDQLYERVAERVRNALGASNAAIFVRDDASGDFNLRVLAAQGRSAETDLDGKRCQLSKRAFVVRRLGNLSTPLLIEPREIETWSQALNSVLPATREERASEHEILRSLKSTLLVQIRQKNELVGILSFGPRSRGFQYSVADRELLMSIAAQLALIIDNARLTERMVAQERMRRELALAAEVQQRLLPSGAPKRVGMEVAGFCEPARGVGGDYYDFINFDSQLGLAIADVAGKGMPAALLMSTVQATLRSLTARNGSKSSASELSSIVGMLNRLLFNTTNGEHYVTFFYATFDHATQCLTYVNAGHNPPLFLQADANFEVRELTSGGLVAGAFEHAVYEQETVQMKPNDLLFLYTDGLSEALNVEGEEFGSTRIEQILKTIASLSADQIRDVVARRVKEWCAGMSLYDDLTFVVMKVK
ncbi:MAG TPA: GAF domain-containing SpoIIE family protein phosphatase [Pyrinomonadaceae bacterium]|nr:GAF domain-containing SpoIIE family protein phosphatase [Pyrinomonadaceae bacterium]